MAFSPDSLPGFRQAILLGLARQKTEADLPPLTLLALAGQQQRFRASGPGDAIGTTPEIARLMHDDARPIVPDPVRRALLMLANSVEKRVADAVLSLAIRRCAQAGFRPHPFDLPRLMPQIKGDARCLGRAERAFLALTDQQASPEADGLLHAAINAETWTGFPKAERVAFLRRERRTRPDAARALLETVFKAEPAATRADLLGALDVGLGPDDLPLLAIAAADRTDGVRQEAARLTARVPGTPAHDARLIAAAQCFKRSGIAGILSRIGVTAAGFEPPPSTGPVERRNLLNSLFDGFSAAEVATAAGMTASELIGRLPIDEDAVFGAFAARAALDQDQDMMIRLTEAQLSTAASPAGFLSWLASHLTLPVPEDFADRLLASDALAARLQQFHDATTPAAQLDDGTLIWTAALLPAQPRARFIDLIAPLSPVTSRTARNFADLMVALESREDPAP